MADVGYFALLLALALAVYSIVGSIVATKRGYPELMASARWGLYAVFGLLSLAVLILVYALVNHHFEISYVAAYTSRDLPFVYKVSALWAGNKGSLLFWAWLLSFLGLVVAIRNRSRGRELMPFVFAVVMAVTAFFIIIMVFVSNPFEKMPFVPQDGMGLNPLLEDPGMIFHPPLLLAGYVGFTIPFAFAMAALITGRLGDSWVRGIRRWTLLAWLLLGVGNLLGAWWAYKVLGWGGYWAWDPVENAGIMPWLVGTALLHSIMIQRRRGMLKVWNMVLIILAFNLSIFGTFLTRSGILSSVHTFSESALGPFFLSFIVVSLVGSVTLLIARRKELRGEEALDSWVSRESSFLVNNLLLVGATFAIFWGTVFPLISEAVRGTKITVAAPFFDKVNGPIFLAIIVLMGICPLIGWRRATVNNLLRNFLKPLTVALILGVVLFLVGVRGWLPILGFSLVGFVAFTILLEWFRGTRARRRTLGESYFKAPLGLMWANRPRYGGYIVHLAVLLIALGVIGSTFYHVEAEATLSPGDSMTIDKYELTYEGTSQYTTPDKVVTRATLSLKNSGKFLATLTPEKHFHRTYQQPMTKVAIRSTPLHDVYVIFGSLSGDSATFKVLVNPLVLWIWVGGGVLLAGTMIAFWPGRSEIWGPAKE